MTIHQVDIPDADWDEFDHWCREQNRIDDEVTEHERMNNYVHEEH